MEMFLGRVTLLLSIFLLILPVMNQWMDGGLTPNSPLQYGEVFHPEGKADMIILGASRATHGIDPRYHKTDHLKVCDFLLNGMGPSFNLKEVLVVCTPVGVNRHLVEDGANGFYATMSDQREGKLSL